MATRQKQKRSDDSQIRQPANAPVAEAIALGTAAAGLVIGAMQANAQEPQTADEATLLGTAPNPLAATAPATGEAPPPPADVSGAHQPAIDGQKPALVIAEGASATAAETSSVAAGSGPNPAPQPDPAVIHETAVETPALPNTIPPSGSDHLVQELAGQMQATMAKVLDGATAGLSPSDLSFAVANDIIGAAQKIVSSLNLEGLSQQTDTLADSILAEIDAPGIVDDVLAETSGLAMEIAGLAGLPGELLETIDMPDIVGTLSDLPSVLLGNDGPEGSGGLLSEVFYADGVSDLVAAPVIGGLAIPDLSLAASSVVTDVAGGTMGFLGLSYMDLPTDAGNGPIGGLNALSLL